MAVEVHRQIQFFVPRRNTKITLSDLQDDHYQPMTVSTRVIHSFQHDLESIFWIIVWTLTARIKIAELQKYAMSIFRNNHDCPLKHELCLTHPDKLVWEIQQRDKSGALENMINPTEYL